MVRCVSGVEFGIIFVTFQCILFDRISDIIILLARVVGRFVANIVEQFHMLSGQVPQGQAKQWSSVASCHQGLLTYQTGLMRFSLI